MSISNKELIESIRKEMRTSLWGANNVMLLTHCIENLSMNESMLLRDALEICRNHGYELTKKEVEINESKN